MSLEGKLEDVSAIDVMQFVHLGGRSGTLTVRTGAVEAVIGFHHGRIANAWRTGMPRLGEALVTESLLDEAALSAALSLQERERPRRAIGQVLIGMGAITEAAMLQLLERQMRAVVRELLGWHKGTFEFALDSLFPMEELAAFPGDVAPKIELDTQAVLLDCLRLIDEATVETEPEEGGFAEIKTAPGQRGEALRPITQELPAMGTGPIGESLRGDIIPTVLRLQVLSKDPGLASRIGEVVDPDLARVSSVPLREAGSAFPGEAPPVVVLDARGLAQPLDQVSALHRKRPKATLVVLLDQDVRLADAYEAGAVAALEGEAGLGACLRRLVRHRQDLSNPAMVEDGIRSGFARLKRIVGELRSGLMSTTVSLTLMNAVAESLDRAILFVIQQDHLIPLGAFGQDAEGRPLVHTSRGLRLSLVEPNVFSECVDNGRAVCVSFEQAHLPQEFVQVVGPPRAGQIAVLPVSGSDQVIAAIYVDNGARDRPIAELAVLELATVQLGLALENEFLRRALADQAAGRAGPLRHAG